MRALPLQPSDTPSTAMPGRLLLPGLRGSCLRGSTLLYLIGLGAAVFANPSYSGWIALPLFVLALVCLLSQHRTPYFLRKAFLWGTAQGIGQLAWMATPDYVGEWCLVAAPFLALAIGIQWLFWAWLIPSTPSWTDCLALGGLWALFEYSREWWLFAGLGFGSLSALAADIPGLRLFANLFGHYGLSWWLVAAVCLLTFCSKRLAAFPLFAAPLYGMVFLLLAAPHQGPEVWCEAIQTGQFPLSNMQNGAGRFLQLHTQLMQVKPLPAGNQERLLLLPETALRYDVDQQLGDPESPFQLLRYYQDWALRLGCHLVAGCEWRDSFGSRTGQILFSPEGNPQRYAKQKLLPGAEFIPYPWMQALLRPFGIQEGFIPGSPQPPFQLGKLEIAPLVCYESAFAELARAAVSPSTHLMVCSINDGWYGESSLTRHHATASRLRAIELGCPLLQSGHTGWTGCWDGQGNLLTEATQTGAAAAIVTWTGRLERYSTPWSLWGMSALRVCWALTLLPWFWKMLFPAIRRATLSTKPRIC